MVRTIDAIDSTRNHVGDRFEASLAEALIVDGNVVAAKGADVYGRLEESKETGTFAGRSQLRLQLTGIVVNGQTVPLVTGEYELTGKSKGASTARRTVGGAAIGGIIGAIAGGGKGAGEPTPQPKSSVSARAIQAELWLKNLDRVGNSLRTSKGA